MGSRHAVRSIRLLQVGTVLAGLLACGSSAPSEQPAPPSDQPAPPSDQPAPPSADPATCANCYVWRPLRIGAGGWLTGIDMSTDGSTKVVRADTYGAYVWDSGQWRQLVTSGSMPSEDVAPEKAAGVWEIRVAPGSPGRLYMSYRGRVYRSSDRGGRWVRTAFAPVKTDANDDYRTFGQKMAVDPANADVVYVGSPKDGLFVSADAGATWHRVATVPPGEKVGVAGIAFDPTSGTAAGRTKTVYASSYGNGVWRTTDAGTTWARVAGGPLTVNHAVVAADGALYVTENDGSANTVWRLTRDDWRKVTPPDKQYWHTIAVDPQNPAHIVASTDGAYLDQSADRGETWSGPAWKVTRRSPDIPWLAWTKEAYMSNGDMRFDPAAPGTLWFAQGIGVWTTTVTPGMGTVTWTSRSVGIEQLVANAIAAPPGGRPVLASWDRPLFYSASPDSFPAQHGPNNEHAIVMGMAVDYASTEPTFLAAVADFWGVEQSCYSTDGGRTWTVFPSIPTWTTPVGLGTLAVSTPDNIVWVPSNKRAPYYTKDRGRSWSRVSLPGVADSAEAWAGLHWAYYLNRHIVAADRVNAGTFYMYHTPAGLFRSTDGGASWTRVRAGELTPFSGFNAKLKAVPGKAGHLFFTGGQQSGDAPSGPFVRSTDGGATWKELPGVLEVHAFGFGKEAPGSTYPTVFIAGWVKGAYGIWSSTNEGQSWSRIGDYPLGSLDEVKAVDGDKSTYGIVYVGFAGSGYAYGRQN
jgi:photosystem II stability/assembly factor-like uncharacterized protein